MQTKGFKVGAIDLGSFISELPLAKSAMDLQNHALAQYVFEQKLGLSRNEANLQIVTHIRRLREVTVLALIAMNFDDPKQTYFDYVAGKTAPPDGNKDDLCDRTALKNYDEFLQSNGTVVLTANDVRTEADLMSKLGAVLYLGFGVGANAEREEQKAKASASSSTSAPEPAPTPEPASV